MYMGLIWVRMPRTPGGYITFCVKSGNIFHLHLSLFKASVWYLRYYFDYMQSSPRKILVTRKATHSDILQFI